MVSPRNELMIYFILKMNASTLNSLITLLICLSKNLDMIKDLMWIC